MRISPTVWANRYAPDSASVLLRDGPFARSIIKSLPWEKRASVASDMVTERIELAVGPSGLLRLLEGARNGCQTIRGGSFAETVDHAVRAARGVLTVALLGLENETMTANDVFGASVLLLAAEPGLQAGSRAWIADGPARIRQIQTLRLFGIGAALLSAHMSGPAFEHDALPLVASDLLREVVR